MILILGGTSEGRQLAEQLIDEGYNCLVSVVSMLGKSFTGSRVETRVGPLTLDSLKQLILKRQITLVIDVSHPYAAEISKIGLIAAEELNIEIWRLERLPVQLPESPQLIRVADYQQALSVLLNADGGVLFTIGAKRLAYFKTLWEQGRSVWVKVYPEVASLESCKAIGLRPEQIFAFHGSGNRELFTALLRQTNVQWIVTKNSGIAGGTDIKVAVGLELGKQILVIDRPGKASGVIVDSVKAVLGLLRTRSELR